MTRLKCYPRHNVSRCLGQSVVDIELRGRLQGSTQVQLRHSRREESLPSAIYGCAAASYKKFYPRLVSRRSKAVAEAFVSGKLRATLPPFAEYDVCVHFIESTDSGKIALARLDGAPLGGNEATKYLLTDDGGNVYPWRWSGKFIGGFYLGDVVR
jgi:hypothetical protein